MSNGGLPSFVVNQLQLVNQVAGVVGSGFHCHHSGRLLASIVLNHTLVYLRFNKANQQVIHDGLGFWLGWLLQRDHHPYLRLSKWWLPNLALASGLTAFALYLLGGQPTTQPALEGADRLVFAGAYALAVWFWTFGLIGLAVKFFSRNSKVTRYLADSSYWLYIIHLPIIMAMQVWMYDWDWSAEAKYAFILGTSIPVMLLSYQLMVRHTFIGQMLNGPRNKKAS